MSVIIAGVLPIFAMIALGWGLRASKFLPAESWPPIERITYFVFYPGFLLPAAWGADFADASAFALLGATIGAVVAFGTALIVIKPLLRVDGPAFTSVFQGVLRWNSFIFLTMVLAIYGEAGVGLAAIVLGAMIPVINVLCVLVLARWGDHGHEASWKNALLGMAKNPVILACAAGLILNALGVPRPPILMRALDFLSDAALTLGLIAVGAGLSFRYAVSQPILIGAISTAKLIAMPLVMWAICRALGGSEQAQGIALICGSAPGAAASYVLARQMGGDSHLIAGVIAFTTAASVITIPLLLGAFHLG